MKSEAKSSERASMDHAWCRVSTKRRKYGGLHTSHQWQSGNSIPGYDQRPVAPLATAPDKVTCEAGRRAPGVAATGEAGAGRRPHHHHLDRPSPWTVEEASSFLVLDHLLQRTTMAGAMGGRKLLLLHHQQL